MSPKWLALFVVTPLLMGAAPPSKPKTKTDTAEVKQLYGIDWHTKLDSALKRAAGDKSTGDKPVMVLRVLGDLNGFM